LESLKLYVKIYILSLSKNIGVIVLNLTDRMDLVMEFLISTTQMAFIEQADITYKLLANFTEVYRYINKMQSVTSLYYEIEILLKYIFIKKNIAGDKFNVRVENFMDYKNVYINHLSLINYFDEVLNNCLSKYNEPVYIFINFCINEEVFCSMNVITSNGKLQYKQQLL
jgi:hypothetical protein